MGEEVGGEKPGRHRGLKVGPAERQPHLRTMCPVVWKASSTMVSSWSEAAWWKTEKMFFQPERMLAACEFTIWATHLITMSLMVGDLPVGAKSQS